MQQARGYGLGGRREIPFTLAPSAPAAAQDAPGSASVREAGGAADAPRLFVEALEPLVAIAPSGGCASVPT